MTDLTALSAPPGAREATRILVVEDDDHIAAALSYVIGREGLTCDRIGNGAEALAAIRRIRPDLVLLDIMLPDLSGYDVARAMRSDASLSAIKILMMTARGSAAERARAMAHGADGFVSKPFDLPGLRAELRRLLQPGL